MSSRPFRWALGITAVIGWVSWAFFLFFFQVGAIPNPWDPWRIIFYVLLALVPAITFVPLSLWLKWPYYAPYAVLGWAALGYVLAFVVPPPEVLNEALLRPLSLWNLGKIWYFFPILLVVFSTVLAPLAYAAGLLLFTSRMHRRDTVRAWREAGLLSLYLVGNIMAGTVGLLTWPIALLSLLFLVLVEALFLARKG